MTDEEIIKQWLSSKPMPLRRIAIEAEVSRGTLYKLLRNGHEAKRVTKEKLLRLMRRHKKKTARP